MMNKNKDNRKKPDQKRVERESTRPGVWDGGTPMVVSHSNFAELLLSNLELSGGGSIAR
jgi:hypothetical protein